MRDYIRQSGDGCLDIYNVLPPEGTQLVTVERAFPLEASLKLGPILSLYAVSARIKGPRQQKEGSRAITWE
jgi:hypothetical protein